MTQPTCKLCGKDLSLSRTSGAYAGEKPCEVYWCKPDDYNLYITAKGSYSGKIAVEWIGLNSPHSSHRLRFVPKNSVYQEYAPDVVGAFLFWGDQKVSLGVFEEMTPELARKWSNKLQALAVFQ